MAAHIPLASTRRATAFNVGMISETHVGQQQDAKVLELAGLVESWLDKDLGPVAVGVNETHSTIVERLAQELKRRNVPVRTYTHESNSVLWRTPP